MFGSNTIFADAGLATAFSPRPVKNWRYRKSVARCSQTSRFFLSTTSTFRKIEFKVVMPSFGRIELFEGREEDWPRTLCVASVYFVANDVSDAKNQATFLSCSRPKTYTLLRDLVKPANRQDKSLDEFLFILGNHYCSNPFALILCFRFYSRVRWERASVRNFVAGLTSLSEHYKFGKELAGTC